MYDISVITVSYNSVKTIRQTLESVLSQVGVNIEYIVCDGGSVDGTREIIEEYKDRLVKIIFEPDRGLYNALNKCLVHATARVVAILHSDDFYVNETVLSKACKVFQEQKVDVVYGDIHIVKREDPRQVVRVWKAGEYNRQNFRRGWAPPHPAFFVAREIYGRFGGFREDLSLAADYEVMLRCLYLHGSSAAYLSETLTLMREGGLSSRGFYNRLRGWCEIVKSWQVLGLRVPFGLIFFRVFDKLKQYL